MADDSIRAEDVLSDEMRLALDGYRLDVIAAEHDEVLGRVTLQAVGEEHARVVIALDKQCPTREEAILRAMLGFLNTGGDPARLSAMAEQVATLPHIEPNDCTVLGTYGYVGWVSYYQHTDGRIFEVQHGLCTAELTQAELDAAIEATDELEAPWP